MTRDESLNLGKPAGYRQSGICDRWTNKGINKRWTKPPIVMKVAVRGLQAHNIANHFGGDECIIPGVDKSDTSEHEMPVVPDSFSEGSAPRLRSLVLGRVPFPGLRKILLSATDLLYLALSNIPYSGHISPA
jgi:hypothetical protein